MGQQSSSTSITSTIFATFISTEFSDLAVQTPPPSTVPPSPHPNPSPITSSTVVSSTTPTTNIPIKTFNGDTRSLITQTTISTIISSDANGQNSPQKSTKMTPLPSSSVTMSSDRHIHPLPTPSQGNPIQVLNQTKRTSLVIPLSITIAGILLAVLSASLYIYRRKKKRTHSNRVKVLAYSGWFWKSAPQTMNTVSPLQEHLPPSSSVLFWQGGTLMPRKLVQSRATILPVLQGISHEIQQDSTTGPPPPEYTI